MLPVALLMGSVGEFRRDRRKLFQMKKWSTYEKQIYRETTRF